MAGPLLKSRVEIAPPRGRYDRSLKEAERDRAQRTRVLQATAEQVAARGPGELTVEQIVIHAGISRATFYEHYESLDLALAAVMQLLHEQVIAPTRQAQLAEPTPRGQLEAMATSYLVEVENHPHLVLAGAVVPNVARARSQLRALLEPALQPWIDGARRAGLAAPGNLVLGSGWLAALFEATAVEFVLEGGAFGDVAERLARGCVAMVR